MRWRCLDCGSSWAERFGTCGVCFTLNRMVPVPEREPSVTDSLPEEMTADELIRAAWNDTPTRYEGLRLGTKSLVLVSGPEGAMKSTMVVRALDSIQGPVLFLSTEMQLGPALGELLARCGVKRSDFHCVGSSSVDWLHQRIRKLRAVALAVDSVQSSTMDAADLRHFLATTPVRLVLAVSQLNAAGEPYGARALRHECDVHIEVAKGRWQLAKSRYQKEAAGSVLDGEEVAA